MATKCFGTELMLMQQKIFVKSQIIVRS